MHWSMLVHVVQPRFDQPKPLDKQELTTSRDKKALTIELTCLAKGLGSVRNKKGGYEMDRLQKS